MAKKYEIIKLKKIVKTKNLSQKNCSFRNILRRKIHQFKLLVLNYFIDLEPNNNPSNTLSIVYRIHRIYSLKFFIPE